MRPPGYEPGELPTAPLRDVIFLKRLAKKVQIFRLFVLLPSNYLVVSEVFSKFAHCNCNVQLIEIRRNRDVNIKDPPAISRYSPPAVC